MRFRTCLLIAVMAAAAAVSCSSDIATGTAPVELIAAARVNQGFIDLASPITGTEVADIRVNAITKRSGLDDRLIDVKLKSYRVSYIRTDGGRTVPASYVVAVNQFIAADGAAVNLDNFIAFDPTSLSQAPFAALLPQNGGRDPETGRQTVEMDVRVEIFGETLAGEDVYATARFPVEFCYGCSGV